MISAIAVRGIRTEDARNAVAPTTANAPGGLPGQIQFQFQIPLINVAREALIATLGVKKPPTAPARSELIVPKVLRSNNAAAIPMVKLRLKPNRANPLLGANQSVENGGGCR